jgi:hypothetical protein
LVFFLQGSPREGRSIGGKTDNEMLPNIAERVSIRTISATAHGTYGISVHKYLVRDEVPSGLHQLNTVGSTVGGPNQLKVDNHPLAITHRLKLVEDVSRALTEDVKVRSKAQAMKDLESISTIVRK